MAYNINKKDGTLLITVTDGSINSALTPIKLMGRGISNYGEILNENLVWMVENFADTVPPLNPLVGQFWYDKQNNQMKFWSGTEWKILQTL